MTAPDDERQADLIAFLDGEMDEATAREFEGRLRREPSLRAEAEALKRTWELLDFLPQPEPSPTFTSRTLDKVAVLRPATSVAVPIVEVANSPPTRRRPQRLWPKVVAVATAAALLFVGAFGLSGSLSRKPASTEGAKPAEEQMAQDLRVLDNLPLYQYADDLNFILGLDQPDLFGDEAGH